MDIGNMNLAELYFLVFVPGMIILAFLAWLVSVVGAMLADWYLGGPF